jgi:hypothetical protein
MGMLGVLVLGASLRMGWGSIPDEPGPGFYPGLVGIALLVASVMASRRPSSSQEKAADQATTGFSVLYVLAAYVAWICLMPWFGYVLVTCLVSFAIAKAVGFRGWIGPLVLAVGISLLTYLLLDVWFFVDLPRGLLEGIFP